MRRSIEEIEKYIYWSKPKMKVKIIFLTFWKLENLEINWLQKHKLAQQPHIEIKRLNYVITQQTPNPEKNI
jgi:hypothetical protein